MRCPPTISASSTSWSDMALLAALAAATVLQAPEPGQRPLMLAGKLVPITFPAAPSDAGLAQEVIAWDGFRYLGNQDRKLHSPYASPPDWTWLKDSYEAVAGGSGAAWRTKIVILVAAETM